MRRVRLDEARWPIASHTERGQPSGRDRVWAREVRGGASSVWVSERAVTGRILEITPP
ncbi:hypothetical protein ACU4GA_04155 [Methylobacterium oryzae CBMB20]